MKSVQELADDFREWRLVRNQAAAQWHFDRRDFWRHEIGQSWKSVTCWPCVAAIVAGVVGLVWVIL